MVRLLAVLVASLAASWGALAQTKQSGAQIIARCGPSMGQSFFFEDGLVGPGQGGWRKDGMSEGRIIVWINDDEQIDLVMRDPAGTRSYLAQGVKVSLVKIDEKSPSFIIQSSGDDFIETYLFKLNNIGVGTVVWTSSKLTPSTSRASIFKAECGPQFSLGAK